MADGQKGVFPSGPSLGSHVVGRALSDSGIFGGPAQSRRSDSAVELETDDEHRAAMERSLRASSSVPIPPPPSRMMWGGGMPPSPLVPMGSDVRREAARIAAHMAHDAHISGDSRMRDSAFGSEMHRIAGSRTVEEEARRLWQQGQTMDVRSEVADFVRCMEEGELEVEEDRSVLEAAWSYYASKVKEEEEKAEKDEEEFEQAEVAASDYVLGDPSKNAFFCGKAAGTTAWHRACAVARVPEDGIHTPDQALSIGRQLYAAGQLGAAIAAFEAAAHKDADDAEPWVWLGRTWAELDDDGRAMAALCRARELDPVNDRALAELGVCLINEGRTAEAATVLSQWAVLRGQKGMARTLTELREQLWNLSIEDLSVGDMTESESSAALNVIGAVHHALGDSKNAADAFETAAGAEPVRPWVFWNRAGAARAVAGDHRAALRNYMRAVEQRPGYARSVLNAGFALFNLGRFTDALGCYLHAIRLNPHAPKIWSHVRVALTCAGRVDLTSICTGVENDPEKLDNAIRQLSALYPSPSHLSTEK